MDYKQNKLENPERLAELSPKETLMRIGLGEQDIICDIGAGSEKRCVTWSLSNLKLHSIIKLDQINEDEWR